MPHAACGGSVARGGAREVPRSGGDGGEPASDDDEAPANSGRGDRSRELPVHQEARAPHSSLV